MRSTRYIGNFPPPYGGVTIKNQLIFNELSKYIELRRLKQYRWMPKFIYQMINGFIALLPCKKLIVGISSKGGKSLLQSRLLYLFNKKTMKRSIYFMMGGQEAGRIASDIRQIEIYSFYRKIYVETDSMRSILNRAGLDNVSVFPNCRKKVGTEQLCTCINNFPSEKKTNKLKTVYFSLVSPVKGIDTVTESAKRLPDIEFHIYGEVQSDYKDIWAMNISKSENIKYHGVFKGQGDEVYRELSKYDVMLLPTKWKNEGVPGVIIEAKIAGIPAIVSNICYNAEIVSQNVNGIVLDDTTSDALVEAIEYLDQNRNILQKMKQEALKSAESYYIENYTKDIIEVLERA